MTNMKKANILAIAACALAFGACIGEKQPMPVNDDWRLEGDRTIYGLACEGCGDSTLVLLPTDGSDPIHFSIIEANKGGRVLGKPLTIGDRVCVVPNDTDSLRGDVVINIDRLKGIWCYMVMPRLRYHEDVSEKEKERLVKAMPDSVRDTYYISREYGFNMLSNWVAQSVGYVREAALNAESPVVYPKLGFFTEWHIWNGNLIVTSGTPVFDEEGKVIVSNFVNDTCRIDYLQGDSLVLSDQDGTRGYYRRHSISEVNQKGRAIADSLRNKSLESIKQ